MASNRAAPHSKSSLAFVGLSRRLSCRRPPYLSLGRRAGVLIAKGFSPTIAASCDFMLAWSTPPNAIVYADGRLTFGDMLKTGLWLSVALS